MKIDVATAAGPQKTDELRQVAQQFESLFTHMLMKNMRAASFGDGAMDSEQSKFYQDMFDQELAGAMSKNGGLGIADMLMQQFNGVPSSVSSRPWRIEPNTALAPAQATGGSDGDEKAKFIERLLPFARKAANALKVAPQFLLAQAALETGWGQHGIRNEDGGDSNNLFGIKAGRSWSGDRAQVRTQEYVKGQAHSVVAEFRSYRSVKESFDDYAKLLLNAPRYAEALGRGSDGAGFANALQRAGYATDPEYANKILGIVNGPTFKRAMGMLKIP